ncbi:MAG: ABC transporter ATP-binding protein [Gaiellaceae bacterium]
MTAGRRPLIVFDRVAKSYGVGDVAVRALREVSFTIEQGDFVAIIGRSGSGKSTLMNVLGCLDVPSGGRYLLAGIDVAQLDEVELAYIRNRKIGFVFQSYNLVPRTTALRNVELPLIYARVPTAERRRRALDALEAVGLSDRGHHVPATLSGGQQQRAAIARAIVSNPAIVLADEPTGNLDVASTAEVMQIFSRLNAAGRTIVMITHEHDVADYAKRTIELVDGTVLSDERRVPVAAPPPKLAAAEAVG